MIISIDLGHREIRAVLMDGKKVSKCFHSDIPGISGISFGDLETTAGQLKEALVKNNVTTKKCQFVLPSSAAVIREMVVPRVVEKDISGYVRTQFSGIMQVDEKDVTEYLITSENNEFITVLGFIISASIVEQCLKLAESAGMKCCKVDLRLNALRKYLSTQTMEEDGAYIVAMLENGKAEINLFERTKLFVRTVELSQNSGSDSADLLKNWGMSFNAALVTAPDKSDWTESFAQQIDSIINFQLTRNREMPVRSVYICGEVDDRLQQEVSKIIQLPVDLLKEEHKLPYIFATGAGLDGNDENDFDLIGAVKKKSHQEIRTIKRNVIFGCIMAVILAVQLVAGILLSFADDMVVKEMDGIQAYLTDPEVNRKADMAVDAESVLEQQKLYNQILMLFNQEFDIAFRFQSSYIEGIYEQAANKDIAIEYIHFQDSTINVIGYAANSFTAAEFAGALENDKVAKDVTFQGYQRNHMDKDSRYKFQLVGIIE